MTITASPTASGAAFTLDMGVDSVTTNKVQKVALTEPTGGTFVTPMQQTGGTVGLVAGVAAIGSIIGRTSMTVITPVVTSNGAYVAGNEIGGLMTFPVGGAGTGGVLQSIRVTSKSAALTMALTAFVFRANPSSSTWTDMAIPAINTADITDLLCAIPLPNAIGGLGNMTMWNAGGVGAQFLASNLYVVLLAVSSATLTSGSTSDFTVALGMKVD